MSIAALIRRMAELGTPAEAIALAVEAIEAEQAKDAARRAKRAEQKARERATKGDKDATVARQSHDEGATPSPPLPPLSLPPAPLTLSPLNPPTPESPRLPTEVAPHRGRTIPDDWSPDAELVAYAEGLGFSPADVEREAEAMRDWALANRNRAVARKADWSRTFQGWLRRAASNRARAGPASALRPGTWAEFNARLNAK